MAAPSSSDLAASVRALSEPLAAAAGLVLEDVTITPAGRRRVLRIVVDLPENETGGVPMDAVARASQAISAALDAGDAMGALPYVLEVSSPGADRPLASRRHWLRARGRLVRVVLADGSVSTGRLLGVDDAGVQLAEAGGLVWGDIRAGRVELDFSRPVEGDDGDGDDGDGDAEEG